jgi:hypothetical protein
MKSARFRFFIPFQCRRMHALAWSIWSGRGYELEQKQYEELAGSPVAGLKVQMRDEELAGTPAAGLPVMEQIQDEQLAGSPVAGLKVQMRDEQLAGTPAAGLPAMEQIQDEQLAGDLAAGLAGTGALSRAHQSFSLCKMTQCPNRNLARS